MVVMGSLARSSKYVSLSARQVHTVYVQRRPAPATRASTRVLLRTVLARSRLLLLLPRAAAAAAIGLELVK